MPSAYGRSRSAATYYEYGGVPMHYQYKWTGMPEQSSRAAETRELSGWIETSQGADVLQSMGDDFLDARVRVRIPQSALSDYPVAMTKAGAGTSVRHSGMEQTHILDMDPRQGMGFFGTLSRNEKTALMIAAGGVAAFVLWKKFGRGRK